MKKIFLSLLIFYFIFTGVKTTYANIPGAAHGKAKIHLPDGTEINLPGVKIFRTDMWGYGYCTPAGSSCFGINDGVEVATNQQGEWWMGNDLPEPPAVLRCSEGSGARRCLSGSKNNVPTQDNPARHCFSYNWCGFNCGSNPHRVEPYFPTEYQLPGNLGSMYSVQYGTWVPPYKDINTGNCCDYDVGTFVFWVSPTPTPIASPTPSNTPTPTITPTPSAHPCD